MTSFCHVTFLLSLQNLSLSLNISFLLLSMTKRNHIIQLCQNKPTNITSYCSSLLLKSSPSWLRQKKPNLKHSTLLLNNTLQNNQQLQLTNSTMSLQHELFVISLPNLIHEKETFVFSTCNTHTHSRML